MICNHVHNRSSSIWPFFFFLARPLQWETIEAWQKIWSMLIHKINILLLCKLHVKLSTTASNRNQCKQVDLSSKNQVPSNYRSHEQRLTREHTATHTDENLYFSSLWLQTGLFYRHTTRADISMGYNSPATSPTSSPMSRHYYLIRLAI